VPEYRGAVLVNMRVELDPSGARARSLARRALRFAIREGGNDAVHEAKELDTAAPLGMAAMIVPVATSSAANKVLVPCRL
jgi:hypothetical protein